MEPRPPEYGEPPSREWIEKMRRMTATERGELALRLGDEALERYATEYGISREEARAAMKREAQLQRPRPFLPKS